MLEVLLAILFGSVLVLLFAHVLYPIGLQALPLTPRVRKEFVSLEDVAIIVSINDSSPGCEKKVAELSRLSSRVGSVVVVCDGCEPTMVETVRNTLGVTCIETSGRVGKEPATSLGIRSTDKQILVFTDVGTSFSAAALCDLVAPFSDPSVGAVSGRDSVPLSPSLPAVNRYIRFEMWLRRLESTRGGIIGLSGSFCAARREVCSSIPVAAAKDFAIALECHQRGLLALHVPCAVGVYSAPESLSAQFSRARRTSLHGMTTLWLYRYLLSPFRGAVALKLWCHKVLRWATPSAGMAAFLSGAGLLTFVPTSIVEPAGFTGLVAALALVRSRRAVFGVLLTGVAIQVALFDALRKRKVDVWEPTVRHA